MEGRDRRRKQEGKDQTCMCICVCVYVCMYACFVRFFFLAVLTVRVDFKERKEQKRGLHRSQEVKQT